MSTRRLSFYLLFILQLVVSGAVTAQKRPVYARHGIVVSADRIASAVGRDILKQGGNAIDAAVATAFALAGVNPAAGNIGGGGFMMIQLADGRRAAIDYREKAPGAASQKMYLDENGQFIKNLNHAGYLAVGVPGTVAGLTLALEKFGTMPLSELIKPAITLAEKGFAIPYYMSQHFKRYADDFKKYPASARVFLKTDSTFYEPGDRFIQTDLAATLKRIARSGRDGFYRGRTADLVDKNMRINGGLITKKDLAEYEAVVRKPIEFDYRGYKIISMPPPSSGGITLAIMFNILEGYDLVRLGHNSAAYIHLLVEAMRRAYSTRALYLGDPDFNPNMPTARLLSKHFAAELRKDIDEKTATSSDSSNFQWALESNETTHFSVMDSAGNAVSNTYTLEQLYGSKIVAAGAGFLYNNEMGDFNPQPGRTDRSGLIGTAPNLVSPGKRMLSSMTPTIVSKENKVVMVTGSPGGRTIINTVLQTILNVLDFKMNIFEAVDAARFHHQWLPDEIRMERRGFSRDTVSILRGMGHRIAFRTSQGRAMALYVDPKTDWRSGGKDPRSPNGAAVGY